jgi:hypothetical protein
MVLAQCDVAGLRETQAPTLLSQGLFADICLALASDALPEAGWRNRPGAEIALLPRPATAESCLGSTHESFAPWRSLATARDGLIAAFEAFDVALAGTFAKWGLSYLAQPYSTRTETGLTARRFLAEGGGEILHGAEHKRGDHAHMNQAYGAACLPSLLTWLDSGRTEQPS